YTHVVFLQGQSWTCRLADTTIALRFVNTKRTYIRSGSLLYTKRIGPEFALAGLRLRRQARSGDRAPSLTSCRLRQQSGIAERLRSVFSEKRVFAGRRLR